jgi:hypothetical protein
MRRLLLVALLALPMGAQTWSGVVDTTRAINWSTAGIPTGLPSASWTQCGSTISAYTGTAATINNALAACAANHYVLLGAGTFTLSTGITWTKSNVALRGAGASQTIITGAGEASCFGIGSTVGICSSDGTYATAPPGTIYNWTSGYAKGATDLTLSSVTGIVANQTLLMLDQCDDGYTGTACTTGSSTDTGNFFVCSDEYSSGHGCGTEGATNAGRPHRYQMQVVVPTAINGYVVTIPAPGLHSPTWRTGQSPQVWVIQPIIQAGIENLTINNATNGSSGVLIWSGYQCWVSGVKFLNTSKSAVTMYHNSHSQIQNNYIYSSTDGDPYGINMANTSDNLIVNNIIQQNRSPIVTNGSTSGDVFAYNFTILNQTGSNGNWSFWHHSAGAAYDLWEGNDAAGFANDDIHGSHNMITRFRNRFTGKEDSNSSGITPIFDGAYNRYGNFIGNVLGTSGFNTTYQADYNSPSPIIYVLGWGNTLDNDALAVSTAFRWGNYDTVNAAIRWEASEIPSGISPYANAAPASHTLPASFYLAARPSAWWKVGSVTPPWPPIGPDVTGGNIANVGGTANRIPAHECYTTIMSGPADGSGSALTFDAATCYSAASDAVTTPARMDGGVRLDGGVKVQ